MFGTLAGALSGRKVPFDRSQFSATVDGRIVGVGKTIRIESITLHYELTAPPEHREAVERALRVHPEGCPAHQSVKGAIAVHWDARLRQGDTVVEIREVVQT
ncbi:MAG: OsmC family protein [Chloroflexi bacterium]|nr:OsmC family protein [Chloroflexota bacterium]MBV9897456.1 OsmC family protein [Chloroflexota bacterium]